MGNDETEKSGTTRPERTEEKRVRQMYPYHNLQVACVYGWRGRGRGPGPTACACLLDRSSITSIMSCLSEGRECTLRTVVDTE